MLLVKLFSNILNVKPNIEYAPERKGEIGNFIADTRKLEKIFGEKYLMMVTSRKFYQEGEFNSSPSYCEHKIENKSLNIKYEFVTKDHHEGETVSITNKNFLNKNEEKEWDGYRKNSDMGHTYDHRFYFIKKSDFNIDKWWLGWTEQDVN